MIGTVLQPDLEEMIRHQQWNELREALSELDASDIAEVIIDLPAEDEGVVFRVLPRERAAAVFSYLPLDHQEELIRSLSSEQMRNILQQMLPDDRTRLLEELPAEVTRRLLESLPPQELRSARELLGYPPETAGRYMTPQYVALHMGMTARVVRSLALQELRLRDWWRVLMRELRSGVSLGAWLGLIGFIRVVLWQHLHWIDYGPHYLLVALTVWCSLIGVVAFGSVVGSMFPFLLRRLGFDPATSSAPFVATLVDVTGLIIYFTVAMLILRGAML